MISLEGAAQEWFRRQRAPSRSGSWNRVAYLDAAERLAGQCSSRQHEDGTLRDPSAATDGDEAERGSPAWMALHSYAGTARYVGAVARLVLAGRCGELIDSGMRAMDAAVRLLWEGRERHRPAAEFEVLELVDGLRAFERFAGASRAGRWRGCLRELDPERCYADVFSQREDPRNANTFALASEQARIAARLGGSVDFIDRYLDYQRGWFTTSGMYRDPGEPMVYDLTVRKNLALMRHRGYVGPHALWVEEMLERGGLVSLFSQSAAGQAPFGGRSSQYLFAEATLACVFEYEARRYAARGELDKAAAFVRAARLALASAAPWLDREPPRHIRNAFPPESGHGTDAYGSYTVYAPLAAALFAEAWHLADHSIPEGICPAERGEAAFSLDSAFHKVFVSRAGWSAEIDTVADPAYDATGMGLLHRRGVGSAVALSAPLPARPAYRVGAEASAGPAAIGPCWRGADGRWRSLASCGAAEVSSWDAAMESAPGRLDVETTWKLAVGGTQAVVLRVSLRDAEVRVRATVLGQGVAAVAMQVPVVETDGGETAALVVRGRALECTLGGARLVVSCTEAEPGWERGRGANRNGVYRISRWEVPGSTVECRLSLAAG